MRAPAKPLVETARVIVVIAVVAVALYPGTPPHWRAAAATTTAFGVLWLLVSFAVLRYRPR